MYPRERSLVEAKKNEKFVLLGIDNDESPYRLRAAMEREKITWPVIWEGGSGHVARKWGVHAWPTMYVIDARGVIRAADPPASSLDTWVDELLKEIKAPPPAPEPKGKKKK